MDRDFPSCRPYTWWTTKCTLLTQLRRCSRCSHWTQCLHRIVHLTPQSIRTASFKSFLPSTGRHFWWSIVSFQSAWSNSLFPKWPPSSLRLLQLDEFAPCSSIPLSCRQEGHIDQFPPRWHCSALQSCRSQSWDCWHSYIVSSSTPQLWWRLLRSLLSRLSQFVPWFMQRHTRWSLRYARTCSSTDSFPCSLSSTSRVSPSWSQRGLQIRWSMHCLYRSQQRLLLEFCSYRAPCRLSL